MISIKGLTKSFAGFVAVQDLDFEVPPGTILGYLGPNGAGKTTTQRLLMGLLKPTRGTATVAGYDVAADSLAVRRVTGFMPDTPFLYEFMTARQFLAFVAEVHGFSAQEGLRRVEDTLARFELLDRLDARLAGFSYGMTKKITLASLLAVRPRVLLLDEPTTGMDPRSVRVMKDVVREQARQGVAVMLSTHVLSVAEELCDRVAILSRGRIIAIGSPGELVGRAGAGRDLEALFLELTSAEGPVA